MKGKKKEENEMGALWKAGGGRGGAMEKRMRTRGGPEKEEEVEEVVGAESRRKRIGKAMERRRKMTNGRD